MTIKAQTGQLYVCNECVRALALAGHVPGLVPAASVNVIARHPEIATDCALCERGPADHPAEMFVQFVADRRRELRGLEVLPLPPRDAGAAEGA